MDKIRLRETASGAAKRFAIVSHALRNTFVGGNLTAARFIAKPRTLVSYVNECLFLSRLLDRQDGLPQAPVWKGLDLVVESDEVGIAIFPEAAEEWFRGSPSFGVDLVSLCTLCRFLQPKVIFEIGTLRGSGALHLAGNALGAEVFTLDLGPSDQPSLSTTLFDDDHVRLHSETVRYHFAGRREEKRIHCLRGDSATFDFSPWAGQVDLFFIDGAHSYEYVRNDTLKALTCCRPGAVVAWHDYGRAGINGVSKWLHEFRGRDRQIHRIPGGSVAYARV
jgi:predicted O-methyltransferase YrrM